MSGVAALQREGSVSWRGRAGECASRPLWAYRFVQVGLLLALVWKWSFFVEADAVYLAIPLRDSFFPPWLQSVTTLRVAYLGAVAAVAINLIAPRHAIRQLCSAAALIGTSVLCLHQGSYNDATFTTAWWTTLWSLWLAGRLSKDDPTVLLRRAASLSRLIVSLMLLGGAVGKWTPEYWSGEVLFDIYFRDRDFWTFNFLRAWLDDASLREVATWYSRAVVVIETICGLGLWLLPPRRAAAAGVMVLSAIALFANFWLFSVLLSLTGLAAVGLLVPRWRTP